MLGVGLGLGLTAPASANLYGSVEDPAGDAASPHPAQDITGAALAYDRRRGALVGQVRLRGVASDETEGVLTLFAGRRTATGCDGYPAWGLSTYTTAFRASWHAFPAPGQSVGGGVDRAEKEGERTTVQRLQATDGRLKGGSPDCAIATLAAPGSGPPVVYDSTGPIALKPVPVLGVRLRGVPSSLRAGRTARVRVQLSNAGDARTGKVRVTLGSARGLKASPSTRRLPAVAAGGSRTVTLRVSLTSRARSTTRLRVTATAGDQSVRADGQIRLRRATGGSGGGSQPSVPRTCNRWMPDPFGGTGGSLVLVPC